jgi:hypothetical protein
MKDSDLPGGVVDALYTRLLLRDLFGKVVPGSILLLACAPLLGLTGSLSEALKSLQEMTIWGWLLLYGFAWITGFAIQSFGESPLLITKRGSLIRLFPRDIKEKDFYKKLDAFRENATGHQLQQLERFAVIKEACGNSYVAVLISTFLWFVHWLPVHRGDLWSDKSKFIAAGIFLILYLRQMHFRHVERQHMYMEAGEKVG